MSNETRRQFLQGAASAAAAIVAVTALAGCGGEPAATPAPAPSTPPPPKPEAKPAAQPAAAPAAAPAADAGPVDPSESLAQTLKYVEDASKVDAAANPAFKAGSHCANCMLYTGAEGADTGPCSLFAGRHVKAAGWCQSWAPKV